MKTNLSLSLISSLLIISCGTAETVEDVDLASVKIPDARPIYLGSQEQSLGLQDADNDCSRYGELGIFGIPVGLACHTTPLVGNMLYGENPDKNQDGELTCADYDPEGENGILVSLLCNEDLAKLDGIESMRFKDDGEIAISFADYDSADDFSAVGSWTASNAPADNFPANLRIWTGDANAEGISGVFAARLDSGVQGTIYFDFNSQGIPLAGEVSFVHQEDTSLCATEPSRDTCHFQEIRLKGVEAGGEDNPPPGMHLSILASDKADPEFFLIEGSVRMTEEATAASWENDPVAEQIPELFEVREIYFRTVRHQDNLWGSFDLKDEAGSTLPLEVSPINGVTVAFGPILRDGTTGDDYSGICQVLGSDEQVECETLDYTSYSNLWTGDADINGLTQDYTIPVNMDEVPEEYGIILK